MRAVVIGGTGLVGSHLVRELVARGHAVASLARRPAPHAAVVDMERLSAADVPEADAAFCCLGTTIRKAGSEAAFRAVDHGLVLRFARAARERGIPQLHVVSALGASASSRVFYNRVKGEMERDVAALGFDATCFYRPSLLLGEREERRPAERFGIAMARALAPMIPRRFEGIPAETVARAMARHAESAPRGVHVHESGELWRLA